MSVGSIFAKKPCHAIPPCSEESDAEEEGAPVVCKSCGQVEVVPKSSKTQLTKEGKKCIQSYM